MPTTTRPAESRVSVQIHLVTSLGPSVPWTALSLQGGPDEQRPRGTTSRSPDPRGRRSGSGGNRSSAGKRGIRLILALPFREAADLFAAQSCRQERQLRVPP